ncbi:MAG: NIL domain-containing protein [Eubacteriales bacterium]|nr:NIL domain-containing protein [Eubacteriales bacterium]MDD3350700.1 NIL domain-containing protein [Eubacteriales bacterium]
MNKLVAIKVNGRTAKAPLVQDILTKYGCNIKTRVGFHEASEDQCSMDGVLVLELIGKDAEIDAMHQALAALEGVSLKKIEF